MKINISKASLNQMIYFLTELFEMQGNAGCNDYEMEDTKENRELVKDIIHWYVMERGNSTSEAIDFFSYGGGKIYTLDSIVTDYLIWVLKVSLEKVK